MSSNRTKCILAFNRANGVFLVAMSYVDPSKLGGHEFQIFVEDEFDILNDTVVGGLNIAEDGGYTKAYKIVETASLPMTVYESQFDAAVSTKITKRYPVAEQVNVLGRAINRLSEKVGVEQEELAEMLAYIKLVKDTNRVQKEFYRDSPDHIYVSNAELAEQEAATFEGGIHEALGPRIAEGGRVFS
jgi:hypothetical protein